jgi:hypothetical protein
VSRPGVGGNSPTITRKAEVIARAERVLAEATSRQSGAGREQVLEFAACLWYAVEDYAHLEAGHIHPVSMFPELAELPADDMLGQALDRVLDGIADCTLVLALTMDEVPGMRSLFA